MVKQGRKWIPRLQKIRQLVYYYVYYFFIRLKKVEDNKMVMATNRSDKLVGNLAYIYEAIDKKAYIVHIYLKPKRKILEYIQNLQFIKEIANAKWILIDDFFPLIYPLKIRKESKLIQVWHATGALKKVGYSRMRKNRRTR